MAAAAAAGEEAEVPAAAESEGPAIAVGTETGEECALEHDAGWVQNPEHQGRPVRPSCIRCCGTEDSAIG